MIVIAIAVIAVFADGAQGFDAVDDAAEDRHAGFVDAYQGFPDAAHVGTVKADDEQRSIDDAVQAQRVGHLPDGGRVDEHDVVVLLHALNHAAQRIVQREGLALEHHRKQVQRAGQVRDGLLCVGVAPVQGVEGVAVIDPAEEQAAKTGIARVQVDQQHLHAQVGQVHGQIGDDRRLAFVLRGGGRVEAGVGDAAQTLLQDVRNGGVVVRHNRIGRFILRLVEQIAPLAEVGLSLRNFAQQLHAELVFHVVGVEQGGVDEQLQHGHAHAHERAQNGHVHPHAGIEAAADDVLGVGLVDDGHAADFQRADEDIGQNGVDRRQDGDALLCAAPVEVELDDLRRVVLVDLEVVVNIPRGYADQAELVNRGVERPVAADDVDDRVDHVLRQMDVRGGGVLRAAGEQAVRVLRGHCDGGRDAVLLAHLALQVGDEAQHDADDQPDSGTDDDQEQALAQNEKDVFDAKQLAVLPGCGAARSARAFKVWVLMILLHLFSLPIRVP